MLESVLAVLFVSFLFVVLFHVSQLLLARIFADHAAARAARAKCVGFNDFMCRKSARVALIPVSGERLWPEDVTDLDEVARVPIYLCAPNEPTARGLLEYERWSSLRVDADAAGGLAPKVTAGVRLRVPRFVAPDPAADTVAIEGAAEIEAHYPFYLEAL